MRIWDIEPGRLCRQHLLGEHRELHALWVVLTEGKKGFARHPEAARWRGKLQALFRRHESLAAEMSRRGYRHATPLPPDLATGQAQQDEYKESPEEQVRLLRSKGCGCRVFEGKWRE
jgi:hypothetical protein